MADLQKQLDDSLAVQEQLEKDLLAARAALEKAKEDFQANVNRIVDETNAKLTEFDQARQRAEELTAAVAKDRDRHANLAKQHWALVLTLKDNDEPAALAIFKEIRRLEIIGQRASLDAQEAALKG